MEVERLKEALHKVKLEIQQKKRRLQMNLKINFLSPNFLLTGLNTINPALNFTLVSKVMKYWLFLKNM